MNGNQQSDAKQRMENFFNNEISIYVLPDIDRLTNEIRPNGNGLRGLGVHRDTENSYVRFCMSQD